MWMRSTLTLDEYKEKVSRHPNDKENSWYTFIQPIPQAGFIHSGCQNQRVRRAVMEGVLDSHFISNLEQKLEKTQIKRVDSETLDKLLPGTRKIDSVLSKKKKNW